MLRRTCILAALAASIAGIQPAAAERIVSSLSRHQVLVSSNFTGTSIVLFGSVEPDTPTARRRSSTYDIVVTITGPRETVVTRRKERVLGIWANVDSRTFVNVPTYIAALANRPFENIAIPDTRRRLQVGLDNIVLPQEIGSDIGDVALNDPFRANFMRLKMEHGLYSQRPTGVTFLTPTLFRSEIQLPAVATFGNYDVDVKLFAGNEMIARANSAFEIVKVGFEQFVATAARDYGLFYGIVTAMLALFTGWFASVVFRRD